MKLRWKDEHWRQSMRIHLDYTNVCAETVGKIHGLTNEDFSYIAEIGKRAQSRLIERKASGELGFLNLPYQSAVVEDVKGGAQRLQNQFESFVVIGIGGSALGNRALHSALNPPFYNELPASVRKDGLKLYIPDNIDPVLFHWLLKTVDVKRTVFNVITKSGDTAETMANFLVIRKALVDIVGEKNYHNHIVVTTDPEKGLLRRLALSEGFRSYPVPQNVGGRYSVLSSVGLLSAAVTNIDIEELLSGAAYMDEICTGDDVMKNPALMNAAIHYLMYQKGKHISVMLPYAHSLYDVADWYRQLWAESLGKRYNRRQQEVFIGPTPIKALGATDQHSQIQLYIEGTFDKIITFIAVEKFPAAVMMHCPYINETAVNYLNQRTLNELLDTERQATEWALTQNNRPNCAIVLPEINPFTIGQLIFMLELQTAYAGELFDVNAFDQPGVEGGKIATYALMGKTGFEDKRKTLEAAIENKKHLII